jgi:hypothetical protein
MKLALPVPGGCNCGQVRYLLNREPLTCYICHCHLCQKRTGGPFSMTLVLPPGAVEPVEGETERTARVLPSGAVSEFWSCLACHSRLWGQRDDRAAMTLRAGTLDDTTWVRPVAQFWVSSAQPWAVAPDILAYDEQPTDPVPMIAAWQAYTATG